MSTLAPPGPAFSDALAGQFILDRELGRGGMGVVYLARDILLERQVAIKVLPPELARDREMRERFLREARTAAQLAHPNIVPVYRADEADGFAWFVMGYVEGETLGERIQALGPMSPGEAIRVLREVAWALAYAHARGIVHRDVKPENVLIERGSGRALVTDFGIARRASNPRLTQDGTILGSVHFMSPEQIEGRPLDGRSDLYSLGVVGFYALSGRLPFEGDVASAVLLAQATHPAPPLASVAPDTPAALAQVIDRCLAKDPEQRFATCEALAEALGRVAVAAPQSLTPPRGMPAVLREEQAQAVWRRAAQLQAEATQRLQARLTSAGERAVAPPDEAGGYRASMVEAAAVEAGIGAEFVAMAMAELSPELPAGGPELTPYQERVASYLGLRDRSLSVSRTIRSSPRLTLAAIGRVLPGYPFELRLRDTLGGHPLHGGVLLFDVPGWTAAANAGDMGAAMYFKYYLHAVRVRQIKVTLRAVARDPGLCEVTVHGDLRSGIRKATTWALPTVGAAVAGGGASAFSLGVTVLGLGPLVSVLPALGGATLLGGLAAVVYRLGNRFGFRKARQKLEELLDAVDVSARSQSLFGVAEPVARPKTGPVGDDGLGGLFGA